MRINNFYLLAISIALITMSNQHVAKANKFEPYTLNGGLVSAISGPDYVIIASDSRLSDGGYNILARDYIGSRIWAATDTSGGLVEKDGSVRITAKEVFITDTAVSGKSCRIRKQFFESQNCPTFVASAGCAGDCEALKRKIRSEIISHQNWNYGENTLTSTGVANLLGQTLYSRRGFPFYSFCICAGLQKNGNGLVHIYDAIGSHERVAVACAGNAKEMLQPVLDRMFLTASSTQAHDLRKDGKSVLAANQRTGLKLRPPVETFVSCDEKRALTMLVRGYRAVAEREISIGDNLVVTILKRHNLGKSISMEVMRFPLKKH